MALVIGRLVIDQVEQWSEQVGEPVARAGGHPVPSARSGVSVNAVLGTFAVAEADRERIRRQLRSLINNFPLRLRGIYIAWSEDPDQDGWYVPGQATLEPVSQNLTLALYRATGLELALRGRTRTHRRGLVVQAADRRLSTTPRDILARVYSSDFSTQAALGYVGVPSHPGDVLVSNAAQPAFTGARATIDGGLIIGALGMRDTGTLTFEQAAGHRLLGDVVIKDRRGVITGDATDDPAWEEVYGPDWPLAPGDAPVLSNGLCRVRWDGSHTGGLVVDAYLPGTGWVEQGKVLVTRIGDSTGISSSLAAARVVEWTPERGVVEVVLLNAQDAFSREVVYVTLQRGWAGPRLECYGREKADGSAPAVAFSFHLKDADTDDTVFKVDSGGAGAIKSTAGSGSSLFSPGAVGAATFTGENWMMLNRQGPAQPFSVAFAVVQAAATGTSSSSSDAYGGTRNAVGIVGPAAAGYVSVQLGFVAMATDQALEAESMTLESGTTAVADAGASGGAAASATRTTEAAHVSKDTNLPVAKFRVFARVRVAAGTGSFRAVVGGSSGSVKTTTSTSYVWVDLGELATTDADRTVQINAWNSGSNNTFVDRVELVLVEDRTAAAATYLGARDLGQMALVDSRGLLDVFPR